MRKRQSTTQVYTAQICKLAAAGDPRLSAAVERAIKNAYRRGLMRGYSDGWNAAKTTWRPHKRLAAEMEREHGSSAAMD